jgi:hypothetical protein
MLALVQLTLHDGHRAWRGYNRDVLGCLHANGMIYDPLGTTKSVGLTEEGLRESEQLLIELFL